MIWEIIDLGSSGAGLGTLGFFGLGLDMGRVG